MSENLPKIFHTVPHEIIDSRLFKFEVELPSAKEYYCKPCHVVFPTTCTQCPQCGTTEIKLQSKKVLVDVTAHVSMDYDTVERDLVNVPSELAFWSSVYAEAKLRTNILERAVKTARALAHDEIVKAALAENTRLPQDAIKTLVEKDERVNRAEVELATAHMVASKMYYLVEAIRMKGDLSRTLTSLKRSEQSGS